MCEMCLTPNLSTFTGSLPKPNKKEKAKPKPLGAGKKTKEWMKERSELEKEFDELGITSCEVRLEGCWGSTALGFAHLEKRRKLTKEDLGKVVRSCNPCHMEFELYNPIRMKKLLEEIIKGREARV